MTPEGFSGVSIPKATQSLFSSFIIFTISVSVVYQFLRLLKE